MIIDITHKRPPGAAFVPRARDDHVHADSRTSDAVDLVVDELPRGVELGARLTANREDVAAFYSSAAGDGGGGVAVGDRGFLETRNESELPDGRLGRDTI